MDKIPETTDISPIGDRKDDATEISPIRDRKGTVQEQSPVMIFKKVLYFETDSLTRVSSLGEQNEKYSDDLDIEYIKEERSESDDDDDDTQRLDRSKNNHNPNPSSSKRSVLGLDYTVKEIPIQDIKQEGDESDCEFDDLGDRCDESDTTTQSQVNDLGLGYLIKKTPLLPVITPLLTDASTSTPAKKKRQRRKLAKTYYCAYCEFNSPRWDRLKEHLIVHYEECPFACEHCDFKTKTAKKLKRHQTVHSEERNFECSLCNLTFKRAYTLKEHILTHTKEKVFFCSLCDFSTHRSQYLKRHMMKHTNEMLQCNMCTFQTVYATLLRRHYQSHTGKKRFRCPICSTYSSSYPHCLPSDQYGDEPLFHCGVCDFSTAKTSDLRTHMFTHDKGGKKFKCDYCEYSSNRTNDLRRHRARVHRVLLEQEHREEEECRRTGEMGQEDLDISYGEDSHHDVESIADGIGDEREDGDGEFEIPVMEGKKDIQCAGIE